MTVAGIPPEEFVESCRTLGAKPIVITDDSGSSLHVQMMTGKFHKTPSEGEALGAMNSIADHFGPRVVRRKLEKILGPRTEVPSHLYLEFHSKYEVPRDRLDEFEDLVRGAGGRTARNAMKPGGDGDSLNVFATTRSAPSYDELTSALWGFERKQTIRECVVFDDNPSIDDRWGGPCDECGLKTYDQEALLV